MKAYHRKAQARQSGPGPGPREGVSGRRRRLCLQLIWKALVRLSEWDDAIKAAEARLQRVDIGIRLEIKKAFMRLAADYIPFSLNYSSGHLPQRQVHKSQQVDWPLHFLLMWKEGAKLEPDNKAFPELIEKASRFQHPYRFKKDAFSKPLSLCSHNRHRRTGRRTQPTRRGSRLMPRTFTVRS